MDIGEKCFVQAEVDENDIKRSFVHIGLGNYVQFDTPAALDDFIEKRREFLTRKIEYMNSRIELMGADVEQVYVVLVISFVYRTDFSSLFVCFSILFFVDEANAGSIGGH